MQVKILKNLNCMYQFMLEKDLFPLSEDMHKKVQPINTFKFKDDRRSVTTEEIWVN